MPENDKKKPLVITDGETLDPDLLDSDNDKKATVFVAGDVYDPTPEHEVDQEIPAPVSPTKTSEEETPSTGAPVAAAAMSTAGNPAPPPPPPSNSSAPAAGGVKPSTPGTPPAALAAAAPGAPPSPPGGGGGPGGTPPKQPGDDKLFDKYGDLLREDSDWLDLLRAWQAAGRDPSVGRSWTSTPPGVGRGVFRGDFRGFGYHAPGAMWVWPFSVFMDRRYKLVGPVDTDYIFDTPFPGSWFQIQAKPGVIKVHGLPKRKKAREAAAREILAAMERDPKILATKKVSFVSGSEDVKEAVWKAWRAKYPSYPKPPSRPKEEVPKFNLTWAPTPDRQKKYFPDLEILHTKLDGTPIPKTTEKLLEAIYKQMKAAQAPAATPPSPPPGGGGSGAGAAPAVPPAGTGPAAPPAGTGPAAPSSGPASAAPPAGTGPAAPPASPPAPGGSSSGTAAAPKAPPPPPPPPPAGSPTGTAPNTHTAPPAAAGPNEMAYYANLSNSPEGEKKDNGYFNRPSSLNAGYRERLRKLGEQSRDLTAMSIEADRAAFEANIKDFISSAERSPSKSETVKKVLVNQEGYENIDTIKIKSVERNGEKFERFALGSDLGGLNVIEARAGDPDLAKIESGAKATQARYEAKGIDITKLGAISVMPPSVDKGVEASVTSQKSSTEKAPSTFDTQKGKAGNKGSSRKFKGPDPGYC